MQVALAAAREGVHSLLEMPFCSLFLQGEELSRRGMRRPDLMVLRVDFFFFFLFCKVRPGSCFSLTVSRWCCWNTKISSVFGMVALRPPAPQRFLCSSTILQA